MHLHLSSCLIPADSLISRICATSTRPPSSLANLDIPDKMTLVWPSTLQHINRWRHNEYSCCSHPSCSYSFTHTCCQGQTSGLIVRPDAAWYANANSTWKVSCCVCLEILCRCFVVTRDALKIFEPTACDCRKVYLQWIPIISRSINIILINIISALNTKRIWK